MPGSFRFAFRLPMLYLLWVLPGLRPASAQQAPASRVVLDVPGYPLVFELDPGEGMDRCAGARGQSRYRKAGFGTALL
jgi:hypothetical protein